MCRNQIGLAEVACALSACAREVRYPGTGGQHCFHFKIIIHNEPSLLQLSLSEMSSCSYELSTGHVCFHCGTL